jgi:N-formylglutamate deformylase
MRDAVLRRNPEGSVAPLVLDSPHSGEEYPADFDNALPLAELRKAEDTHVARLWSGARLHGATLIEATFPRAYIDPNRSLDDVDMALFAPGQCWPGPVTPSRKTEQGIGLVWRLGRHGVPLYRRWLTVTEVRSRVERCYLPYHAALDVALDERHAAFGQVWHLNCHSMPAVGDVLADDPGRERADIVLGDREGTTCTPAFTTTVRELFERRGYHVAVNDPYKGVEIVRRHGRPAAGRHSLQVEIKRTLYMDEATLEPNAGFSRLVRDLTDVTSALVTWISSQPGIKSGSVA